MNYEAILNVQKLAELKEVGENRWEGLLGVPKDGSIYPYRSPVIGIQLYLHEDKVNEKFGAFVCIASYDDHGCSIFGPKESKEKALKRLMQFKQEVEDNWNLQGPDEETLKDLCEKIGMFPDYW